MSPEAVKIRHTPSGSWRALSDSGGILEFNSLNGYIRSIDYSLFPAREFRVQLMYWAEDAWVLAVRIPAGKTGPPAHHHPVDQMFLTLTGELELELGTDRHTLKPGSVAVIPAGVAHRNWNEGPEAEVHLELMAPGIPPTIPPSVFVAEGDDWSSGGSVIDTALRSTAYAERDGSGQLSRQLVMALPAEARDPIGSVSAVRIAPRSPVSEVYNQRGNRLYFVSAGSLAVEFAGQTHDVGRDTLVLQPAGIPHWLQNTTDEPASYLEVEFGETGSPLGKR